MGGWKASLEIIRAQLPISPISVQTFHTARSCFMAWIEVLAVLFAEERSAKPLYTHDTRGAEGGGAERCDEDHIHLPRESSFPLCPWRFAWSTRLRHHEQAWRTKTMIENIPPQTGGHFENGITRGSKNLAPADGISGSCL